MRFHRDKIEQGCLPLSMATVQSGPSYDDQVSELTTLCVSGRCADCPWPAVCEGDQTCWEQERGQGWSRSSVELRRSENPRGVG